MMNSALLAELFCGQGKARLLSALFLADRAQSPKEFSTATGLDRGGVSRWLSRWSQLGIAERNASGRGVTYSAARNPVLDNLRPLFLRYSDLASDLLAVVAERLPGDTAVAFHGPSTMAGLASGGRRPTFDLLIVHRQVAPDEAALATAIDTVAQRHGRPIALRLLSVAEFSRLSAQGSVMAAPVVMLSGALPGEAAGRDGRSPVHHPSGLPSGHTA